MQNEKFTDTIVAVATPPGSGGIAVIRVSGQNAFEAVDQLFTGKQTVKTQKPNTVALGKIFRKGKQIDQALISVFHAPNSFTGENTVEINCHGSVFIQREILKALLESGCRMAKPGEFTQKAFLNGKIDLSQAEAVADLIASQSESAHSIAVKHLAGALRKKLQKIRSTLLDIVSMIELELDFSEEHAEVVNRKQMAKSAEKMRTEIEKLTKSFKDGNALKNGITVVIAGQTNAGKSTLLNLLLNEEKAIVSQKHGTTRDVVEDKFTINGTLFKLVDTAGIRNTDDEIELMGIERTFKNLEKASIIVWMIDATNFNIETEYVSERIVPLAGKRNLIIVFNKIDQLNEEEMQILDSEFLPDVVAERICLSAKYGKNTQMLENALVKAAGFMEFNEDDVIITSIRHYEALSKALPAALKIEKGLKNEVSAEFIAQDARECMDLIGEITGEITTNEVLENIFKNFCIGK